MTTANRVNSDISRICNQIKQQIKNRNKCDFKLAQLYYNLLVAVDDCDEEFKMTLKNIVNFSETQIETALSLVELYEDTSRNERLWEILGQNALRDLQKLDKNDYRRIVNTINARGQSNVNRREIVTLIHACGSYPQPKITKLKAEHEALGRLVASLLETGAITLKDIPVSQTIDGKRVNLRVQFEEIVRNL